MERPAVPLVTVSALLELVPDVLYVMLAPVFVRISKLPRISTSAKVV